MQLFCIKKKDSPLRTALLLLCLTQHVPLGDACESARGLRLVSNKCEALESGDLQILVLLGEPLSNSSLVTITELELLVNALCVKSYRLHGSHLHGNEVTLLGSGLVGLNHGAQSVLTHVVINLDVVTLKSQVAVQLHLLTGDTRTLCNSLLSGLTVNGQSLNSLDVLSLGSDATDFGQMEWVKEHLK